MLDIWVLGEICEYMVGNCKHGIVGINLVIYYFILVTYKIHCFSFNIGRRQINGSHD